jgi:adenosylhomocysteine nucleosidase
VARRIAFLAPMKVELQPIVKRLKLRPDGTGDHTGRRGADEIVATMIGIGPKLAAEATERVLQGSPDHVVVVGIAGAVDAGLRIGDVVFPEVVVADWSGAELHPSAPPAERRGLLLTSAELKTGPDVLARHLARGVTAVDMETAAVGEVCDRAGVPWSVVRSISDRLQDDLIDPGILELMKPDGSTDALASAKFLATHPQLIPRLAKLARDSRTATDAAAAAAIRVVLTD